ncbi:hypothetical protein ACKWTF_003624 [Chironomus riparius]
MDTDLLLENIMEDNEFMDRNYGSTTAGSSSNKERKTASVTYCLHGKLASDCCESDSLKFKTIKDAHCHRAHRRNQRVEGIDKKARKKLIIASILCVVFMIVEIVGGLLSNSLAIATDAAHLLADLASFMISLLALYIANRKSTKRWVQNIISRFRTFCMH